FRLPSGNCSVIPNVVCHAMSAVLASTAIRRAHGGFWHGRFTVRPLASLIGAVNAWNGPGPSNAARSYGAFEPRVSNLYSTPGFFFSTHPMSDVSCEFMYT